MIIITDTREQKPLEFAPNHYIECIDRKKLNVGDYAVRYKDGYIPPFRFERKSISDLFGTMGRGYKRFKKEMIRAQEQELQLIIIVEGTMQRVKYWTDSEHHNFRLMLADRKRHCMTGDSLIKKLFTLYHRYGIQTVFCKDRTEMADYIVEFFVSAGKEYLIKVGKRRL